MRRAARRDPDPSEPSGAAESPRPQPACPACGSRDVEVLSWFGTQAMTLQYRCRQCRTPFEAIKYDDEQE